MHHLNISRCKFRRRRNAREETLSYFTADEKKKNGLARQACVVS